MRSSTSSHRLSYRTKVSSRPGGSKCLTLDCKSILNLLHVLDEKPSQAESSTTVGQKRPRALSHMVSRKRRIFGIEQTVASCPPNESIPVLHHEFDLQYSKERQEVYPYVQLISDNEAEENGLISSEESLVDFLRNVYASFTEPITLDCGDVLINSYGEYGGTVDAKPSHLEEQRTGLCDIFVVPSLNAENIESGGHLFSWVDALTRYPVSQPAIEVTAGLRMVVSPLTSWDDTLHTLPFRLVVDVVLSLRSPSIFQPPPYHPRKGQSRIEIENARRGLLHLAFPPPPLPETLSTSFHGRIDVPFLYAVVQPARELLHEFMDKFLQPQVLLPRLLPFQRRTVCWMLSREGKAFGPTGELSALTTDAAELPVLWRRVTVQRDDEQLTWYYHRLTGTLTPERPGPRTVLGGILAEEPGLGKTLECIALILVNPSIERSISDARWDSEGNLNIREIRVYCFVLFCLRSLY
jgi:E3 ubiquitin-protein ligase SHPRH